ncbi:MAG: glucans biosynthesis glucosyltransferase MdoH [Methyloligellaceae bacterium]
MITQNLWAFDSALRQPVTRDWTAACRRIFVFGGTVMLSLALTYYFYQMLSLGGMTLLQWGLLLLFCINVLWLSLSFMTGLSGFLVKVLGLSTSIISVRPSSEIKNVSGRTAILIPTYNEGPDRIFGTALAVNQSLIDEGVTDNFDVFVLSDTTDPDIWVQEETAFSIARDLFTANRKLHYRRRRVNTGKKAGNVAEWVTKNVSNYDHMIVFDADSLMTGDTLISLADAMDSNSDVALIQTVPQCIKQKTVFARMQQFAGQVYGKILSVGLAFWHRGEGNFWGHNAIIRVKAFHDCCGLPTLPGTPPFGGPILSHDFVEAALLRRAGWRVCMVPEQGGSYEESPPSMLDFAQRDRRWCQGNLQHSRVLPAKGLHWVNRIHLMTGIMAYMSTLVWLIFLVTGLLITLQAQYYGQSYFAATPSLFPVWPKQDSETAFTILLVTLGLLLVPKLFGYFTVLFSSSKRKQFGGAIRLTAGVLIETIISSLLAPIMMLMQSMAIFDILAGRDSGWNAQSREDGSIPVSQVLWAHRIHMIVGVAAAFLCYSISIPLLLWMSPLLLGLILSGPLSVITSRRSVGEWFMALKIFAIPEELKEPAIVSDAEKFRDIIAKSVTCDEALSSLATNPELYDLHHTLLGKQDNVSLREINVDLALARAKLEAASSLAELIAHLTPKEKTALLSDLRSIRQLQTYFTQVALSHDLPQKAQMQG